MENLRLLKIWNGNFHGNIEYLSNELQFLEWHECPLNSLPSDFESDKLVELNLYSSRIEQLWEGEKSLPSFISLESLKSLTLSACSSLKKFPDIEGNMESLLELNLDGTAIEDLPPSFGLLTGRSCLNLGDCKNLLCLPSSIKYLTSLKNLILAGCSKLDGIPENLNCFEFLEMLDLSGTALRQTSSFAGINNHVPFIFGGGVDGTIHLLDYRSRPIQAVCNLEGIIPEWFNHVVSGNFIKLQLSQDLKDDRNWMGVALCVEFSVKGTHESEVELELMNQIDSNSKTFYLYHCTLGTEEFAMEPDLLTSAQMFRKIAIPCVKVQKCGIRLPYKQDVPGFIETFMQYFDGSKCNLIGDYEAISESGWGRSVPTSEESSVNLLRIRSGWDLLYAQVSTIVKRTGLSNGISDYKDGLVVAYVSWTQFLEHYFIGASPTNSMICTLFRTDTPGIEVQICGFRILYRQDLQGFVETVTGCMSHTSDTPFEIYDPYVSPGVELKMYGFRVLYQKDLEGFVQTIIQCILRGPDILVGYYNDLVVADWLGLVRLQSCKVNDL
ncbi:PREDICTED: TMV resistance [Prunus dulcis]|uniref:PREDICTED: TMV resistance n=1 Tax=Prunus dulcis TaxID=3755 RepID=A0A5E4EHH1_PRUDU|nr:PREDICTED: TMV resistance [Prunus dulcis]